MNGLTRWQRPGFLGFGRANGFRDELEALFGSSLAALAQAGFALRSVDLTEIEKAGGSLRCCVGEIF